MPLTPVNCDPVKVLNALRVLASDDYQARIPEATRENLKEIGLNMSKAEYALQTNEFIAAIFNKIGKTIIESASLTDPLARYKKGTLEYGTDIEHIFVDITSGFSFEDIATTASDPFPIWQNNVKSLFYRLNRRDYYPITVRGEQIRMGFQNSSNFNSLLDYLLGAGYNSAQYDEWLLMKQMFGWYASGSAAPLNPEQVIEVDMPVDETTGKEFFKQLQQTVLDLSFPSRAFNPMQVMQKTDRQSLDVIVLKDVLPIVNVDVLAAAFNMGKITDDIRIIPIDSFGDPLESPASANIVAMVFDRGFIQVYDTWVDNHSESIRNPRGLYTNHYRHIWQLYAASLFHSVAILTTDASTIPTEPDPDRIRAAIKEDKLVKTVGNNVEATKGMK